MKHGKLSKLTAILLTVTLLSQLLTIAVSAETVQTATNSAAATSILEDTATPLLEITERREESVKHYMMADGSFMAVQYGERVHYKESEGASWKDIDNTLELTSSTTARSGAMRYSPKASPVKVSFAQSSGTDDTAIYTIGEHTISWSYTNSSASTVRTVQAEPITEDSAEVIASNEPLSEFSLENSSDGIVYNNIYNSVAIEYIVTNQGLKENIVLSSSAASNTYVIAYNIGKLSATQVNDKTIALLDGDKEIAEISAPYMIDSNGEYCYDLTLSLEETKDEVIIVRLTASQQWLRDKDRAYPVTIDPYIFETMNNPAYDASALYQYSSYPYGSLVVGKSSSYGKSRAFLKFDLPTLSKGDVVIGGNVNVAQFKDSYGFSASGISTM